MLFVWRLQERRVRGAADRFDVGHFGASRIHNHLSELAHALSTAEFSPKLLRTRGSYCTQLLHKNRAKIADVPLRSLFIATHEPVSALVW